MIIAPRSAIAFFKTHATWAALALLAGAAITLKLENTGLQNRNAACAANLQKLISAQDRAAKAQAATNLAEQRRTAANAQRSNAAHAQNQIRAIAAGRTYADHHRITVIGVRAKTDHGAPGAAPAAAAGGSAGISAGLPADNFVAISDPDLQACTTAVTYAVAAHNWAATLPANAPAHDHDAPVNPPLPTLFAASPE